MTDPVALIEEITPSWLSAALGHEITAIDTSEVGTGQMGSCYRLRLTSDADLPETLLVKLPTTNAGMREFLHGSYATEIGFYRDLAPTVKIRVPQTWYSEIGEKGVFTLLMEDLAPAQQGDQIRGCTVEQARNAVITLAGLHGPRWSDQSLITDDLKLTDAEGAALMAATLPGATETTIGYLSELIEPEDAETLKGVLPLVEKWALARSERFGIVHGDYRLDNLMFLADAPEVWAVDWQGMSLGLPARDIAYLLGTSLSIEDRRAHEEEIVRAYYEALLGYGVTDYSFEQCFDDYKFGFVQMPLIVIFGCAYGSRTERGDQMFATMIQRGCAAMRDHRTLDLI